MAGLYPARLALGQKKAHSLTQCERSAASTAGCALSPDLPLSGGTATRRSPALPSSMPRHRPLHLSVSPDSQPITLSHPHSPQIIAVAALAMAGSASAAKNETKLYAGKLTVLEKLSNKARLFSQQGRGCVLEIDG